MLKAIHLNIIIIRVKIDSKKNTSIENCNQKQLLLPFEKNNVFCL